VFPNLKVVLVSLVPVATAGRPSNFLAAQAWRWSTSGGSAARRAALEPRLEAALRKRPDVQEVRVDVDPPQRAAARSNFIASRSCCSEVARLDGLTREHDIDEAIKVIHPSPDMLTVP